MAERGGRRQGAPGRSYTNRTDLNVARAPQQGLATAAAGGIPTPPTPAAAPAPVQHITPDQVPRLDDPSARPGEPVTHGIPSGPGGGPEALGAVPLSPAVQTLQAAYLSNPTPELRRTLMLLNSQGVL